MSRAKLKLLLAGDVMLGRLVNKALRGQPPELPWGDTLPLFRDADWRACNLECILSDIEQPWVQTPKTFHFRSDAQNIAVLEAARIDVLSLANNHTLDHGYAALADMIRCLDRARIAHSGAGANRSLAMQPSISEVAGVKIGFLSFTDNQPEWEADDEHAGIFYVPIESPDARTANLLDWVSEVRGRVDLLIVAAHWGPNWDYRPPPSHMHFGQQLVDAGANIVFGHSPHVVRGIQIYRGAPILYSTGDFIDDYAVHPGERNDRSFAFVLETDGASIVALKAYPTVIQHYKAHRARGVEAQEITSQMTGLCAALGTSVICGAGEGCMRIDVAPAHPEENSADQSAARGPNGLE